MDYRLGPMAWLEEARRKRASRVMARGRLKDLEENLLSGCLGESQSSDPDSRTAVGQPASLPGDCGASTDSTRDSLSIWPSRRAQSTRSFSPSCDRPAELPGDGPPRGIARPEAQGDSQGVPSGFGVREEHSALIYGGWRPVQPNPSEELHPSPGTDNHGTTQTTRTRRLRRMAVTGEAWAVQFAADAGSGRSSMSRGLELIAFRLEPHDCPWWPAPFQVLAHGRQLTELVRDGDKVSVWGRLDRRSVLRGVKIRNWTTGVSKRGVRPKLRIGLGLAATTVGWWIFVAAFLSLLVWLLLGMPWPF